MQLRAKKCWYPAEFSALKTAWAAKMRVGKIGVAAGYGPEVETLGACMPTSNGPANVGLIKTNHAANFDLI